MRKADTHRPQLVRRTQATGAHGGVTRPPYGRENRSNRSTYHKTLYLTGSKKVSGHYLSEAKPSSCRRLFPLCLIGDHPWFHGNDRSWPFAAVRSTFSGGNLNDRF